MEVEESDIYSVFDLLYKKYEKERLDYFKKDKKISNYDSENIIYHLLNKILVDYKYLTLTFRYSVNISLIRLRIKSQINIHEDNERTYPFYIY